MASPLRAHIPPPSAGKLDYSSLECCTGLSLEPEFPFFLFPSPLLPLLPLLLSSSSSSLRVEETGIVAPGLGVRPPTCWRVRPYHMTGSHRRGEQTHCCTYICGIGWLLIEQCANPPPSAPLPSKCCSRAQMTPGRRITPAQLPLTSTNQHLWNREPPDHQPTAHTHTPAVV